MTAAYKKTSRRALLKEVGLPYLATRRMIQKIKFSFKARRGMSPLYLQSLIPGTIGEAVDYSLRNSDIKMPKSKRKNSPQIDRNLEKTFIKK